MDVYMYQSDLYSEAGIAQVLGLTGEVEAALDALAAEQGIDRSKESTFDSGEFPKGPFADGGGEADYPVHCRETGEFMENDLTEDGSAYVKSAFKDYAATGRGSLDVLRQWAAVYREEYTEACREAAPGFPDNLDDEWPDLLPPG